MSEKGKALARRSESTVEDVARRYAQEAASVSGNCGLLMHVWLRGYRNEPLASESESEAVMLAWNAGRRFHRALHPGEIVQSGGVDERD